MAERIVAVFDTIAHADAAERDLQQHGILATAIRRHSPTDADAPRLTHSDVRTDTPVASEPESGGFWHRLFGTEDYASADRHEYEGHLGAGRVLMSIECVDHLQAAEAMRVLEGHDVSEIEAQPSSSTTAGPAISPTGTGSVVTETATEIPPRRDATVGISPATAGGAAGVQPSQLGRGTGTTEEVIPLSEEQIAVGKRMVDRGTTRIRRYVVERPVEEQVTLRGERTTIERRTPVGGTDASAFQERTVEVRERQEEAVVDRTSRVVEEVVVHKEATETTETIRENVRREEVEIDEAGRTTRAGSEPVFPNKDTAIPMPDETARIKKERGVL